MIERRPAPVNEARHLQDAATVLSPLQPVDRMSVLTRALRTALGVEHTEGTTVSYTIPDAADRARFMQEPTQ